MGLLRIQAEAKQRWLLVCDFGENYRGVLQCMFCHSFIDGKIRKGGDSTAAAADSLLVFQKESRRQGSLTSRRLVDETTT
jgi:hypothetical protein